MKLQFIYGGVKYSAESILHFTKTELTDFWRESFFRFYSGVNREQYDECERGDTI